VTVPLGPWFPWVLGLAWGVLALTPAASLSRRRAIGARVATLSPPHRARHDGPSPWRARAVRATGVVGRVVGGLRGRRRARADADRLARDLPVTVDVISVAVAAGCTPYLAVEAAARWAPPMIAAHLGDALRAHGLGLAFSGALEDVATAAPRLRPLTTALLVAERTGAPVAPALERLAAEERSELRRRAEERARQLPVRLLFPLVFLVLPAFGLLTVAPALLAGFGRS
jgi:tight adherence protein C